MKHSNRRALLIQAVKRGLIKGKMIDAWANPLYHNIMQGTASRLDVFGKHPTKKRATVSR